MKPWKIFPDLNVLVRSISQFGQQASSTQFGEFKVTGCPRTPAGRLGFIERHWIEICKFRGQERLLSSLPTGHKDQSTRLLFNQALEQSTLLFR